MRTALRNLPSVPLLEELVRNNMLKCLSCQGNTFSNSSEGLRCRSCHTLYPKRNDVVDFFNRYIVNHEKKSNKPLKQTIWAILDKISLPRTDDMFSKIQDILSRSFLKTKYDHLTSELNEIIGRFGIPTKRHIPKITLRLRRPKANRDFKIHYERHYIEKVLPVCSTIYRNVRITNQGACKWSSRSMHPLLLSYRWLYNGQYVVHDSAKTAFPIDIESHRSITLPLKIDTPLNPGLYKLQIALFFPDQGWIAHSVLNIDVRVDYIDENPPDKVFHVTNRHYNYREDHSVGNSLLDNYLHITYGNEPPMLLELGTGTSPQLAFLKHSKCALVCADINSTLLELGSVYFSYHFPKRSDLCFICSEASNLPFIDSIFDGIVMFSTLHHIPDPESFLSSIKKLIKADRFIAVMCEPVGNNLDFVVPDLEKGINEQIFSLEEYCSVFESTELVPMFLQLDVGSLKVILKKKTESNSIYQRTELSPVFGDIDGGKSKGTIEQRTEDNSTHEALKGEEANYEQFLRDQYMELLKREPDEQGFEFYLSKLQNMELSKTEVIDIIKSSEEYQRVHGKR
jgi:ubiquinone/menaquinone biosynthesis C-methylase UbiE